MSAFADMRASPAFADLLAVSERIGRDPAQIQGPGGNTSLKRGGAMLVKASGTWLADAKTDDIMVPVDAARLSAAISASDPAAADGMGFVPDGENPGGLRPSIETSLHAVIPWPVVLHSHSVSTIAVAVRADAEAIVAEKLADFGAVFVPYAKPGLDLTRTILTRLQPDTRVLVLGNHGLIVGAETVREAERLLYEVSRRLDPGIGAPSAGNWSPDIPGWQAVSHGPTQAIAQDPARLALARGTTLYPDHLIFLGLGVEIARDGEAPTETIARASGGAPRKLIIVPGKGAMIPADASPSMLALVACFGDVIQRIDPGATLSRLTPVQEADLLDWDAEKYRQALEAQRAS